MNETTNNTSFLTKAIAAVVIVLVGFFLLKIAIGFLTGLIFTVLWLTTRDLQVALGVTNLFDEQYYRQKTVFIQGLGAGANVGQPAPPREWYLTVSKRF